MASIMNCISFQISQLFYFSSFSIWVNLSLPLPSSPRLLPSVVLLPPGRPKSTKQKVHVPWLKTLGLTKH